MRAWIASGKEGWRRPLPRPSTRTLPDAITFGGALLLIVLPDETPGALSMWPRGLHSVRIDRCGRAAVDEKI